MTTHRRKLVVYLDQNFLSDIAKSESNDKIKPEFRQIFNLLHRGYLDEKLVVPKSPFHRVESSLHPRLEAIIRRYQGFLGQIDLLASSEIQVRQFVRAARAYFKQPDQSEGWTDAFRENPNRRNRQFDIRVDWGWRFDNQMMRETTAQEIDNLRAAIKANGITLEEQISREREAHRSLMLQEHGVVTASRLERSVADIEVFSKSVAFKNTPYTDIMSQLWAKVLVDYPARQVRRGDATDVELISAYLPYVDFLCTDAYFCDLVRGLKLDRKYLTGTFSATNSGLAALITELGSAIVEMNAVNVPILALVVQSDTRIKENSWRFFQTLGNLAIAAENSGIGWVELLAIDDGQMPSCQDDRVGSALPFYGLQEVEVLSIQDQRAGEILRGAREACRAEQLILIDRYCDLSEDFIQRAVKAVKRGNTEFEGFQIFSTEH